MSNGGRPLTFFRRPHWVWRIVDEQITVARGPQSLATRHIGRNSMEIPSCATPKIYMSDSALSSSHLPMCCSLQLCLKAGFDPECLCKGWDNPGSPWMRRVASPPSSTSRSGPEPSGHVSICSVHHQYSSSVSPFQAKTPLRCRGPPPLRRGPAQNEHPIRPRLRAVMPWTGGNAGSSPMRLSLPGKHRCAVAGHRRCGVVLHKIHPIHPRLEAVMPWTGGNAGSSPMRLSLPGRHRAFVARRSLLQRVPAQNTHFHRGQEPYYHKHLTVLDGIACVCPFQAKTAALLWATAAAAWSCTGLFAKARESSECLTCSSSSIARLPSTK